MFHKLIKIYHKKLDINCNSSPAVFKENTSGDPEAFNLFFISTKMAGRRVGIGGKLKFVDAIDPVSLSTYQNRSIAS